MNSDASADIPTVTLMNGLEMPRLAAGTAGMSGVQGEVVSNPEFLGFLPEDACRPIQLALEGGIRHIDTALIYRSQRYVSQILGSWFAAGKLCRADVFLTSKIYHPPTPFATMGTTIDLEQLTPEDVAKTTRIQFERSLEELGVGYIDCMLLHWPSAGGGVGADSSSDKPVRLNPLNNARRHAAWEVLESYYERGWARSIGVSNFNEHHLADLLKHSKITPLVCQTEASVYQQYDGILKMCKELGIVRESFSPLGRGMNGIMNDPTVLAIADKHQRTAAQVGLRYLVEQGFAITCMSSSADHVKSNIEVFAFELDRDDMDKLSALRKTNGSWGLPSPYGLS